MDAQARTVAPSAAAEERTLFEGRPAALDSLGRWIVALLTVGIAAIVWWFKAVGMHLTVTDQRLILRMGILSRRTEYLELYRVTDLQVEEPLLKRLLGFGRLVVTSSDRHEPVLVLRGLRDPAKLADLVRACVEEQKRRRRVATLAEA
ncbi:MAG: PH domain-containing protein [Deltaproteobacteria bacterium]|nr:PH domain-containing protein [Deltaproteobacteria bacterium]